MINETIRLPDSLQLGHPAIDMQHEVLYVLYVELSEAIDAGSDADLDLDYLFAGLNTYVNSHFAFEESLMAGSRFSGSDHHVREHRDLTAKTVALGTRVAQSDSDQERLQIAQDTKDFLINWLADHIAKVDKQLCKHLNRAS